MKDKQYVAHHVKTEVVGHPGTFVYQDSYASAWLETDEEGWLLLGPLDHGSAWRVRLEPKEGQP